MIDVTLEQLADIIGEVIDLSGIRLHASAALGSEIPIDSTDMMRIVSRIESRYAFRFGPREVLRLETLGDILQAVRRHTARGQAPGNGPPSARTEGEA